MDIVQRFEAIQIQNQKGDGQRLVHGIAHQRPEVRFERAQVVRARQIISDRQSMQAPAVVRELRRGKRDRKEERDLNEIRLAGWE